MRAARTLAAAMAVAMAGTVAPLAAPAASATSTINLTFWSWVPSIQENVTLFNKTHPRDPCDPGRRRIQPDRVHQALRRH